MPKIEIEVNLTKAEVLQFYQGQAQTLYTKAVNGKTVELPFKYLQPYVSNDGIHVRLLVHYNYLGRCEHIQLLRS